MLLSVALHTMVKELPQSFWMMWPVLEMRAGWWTADTLPIITVVTMKMLASYVTEHVSSMHEFVFINELYKYYELCKYNYGCLWSNIR